MRLKTRCAYLGHGMWDRTDCLPEAFQTRQQCDVGRQPVPLYNRKGVERVLVVVGRSRYLSETEVVRTSRNPQGVLNIWWNWYSNKAMDNFVE